jgi:multiple sugar transport system permease protein
MVLTPINEPKTNYPSLVWRRSPWRIIGITLLLVVALAYLLPLFWMVSSSLKPEHEVLAIPPRWLPSTPRWANYSEALRYVPFGRYALNTLLIAGVTIAGHLHSCTIVAYGFARLRAPGRDALFLVLLATMMLPYPVTMVPLYILFKNLGWIGGFLPLLVPSFFGNPFYIFRNYSALVCTDTTTGSSRCLILYNRCYLVVL